MLDSRKRIGGFHAAPEAPGRMAPVDTRLGGCSPGCPGERAGREHGWVGPAGSGSLFLAALTQVRSWAAAAGAAIWWRHQEAPGGGLEALGRGPPQLALVGGVWTPAPAPPRPSPTWAAAPCLHPQMWLPPPRTPPHLPLLLRSEPEPSSAVQGPCLAVPGVGRPGAPMNHPSAPRSPAWEPQTGVVKPCQLLPSAGIY